MCRDPLAGPIATALTLRVADGCASKAATAAAITTVLMPTAAMSALVSATCFAVGTAI